VIVGFIIRDIKQSVTLKNTLIFLTISGAFFFAKPTLMPIMAIKYIWKNDAQKLYFRSYRDECAGTGE